MRKIRFLWNPRLTRKEKTVIAFGGSIRLLDSNDVEIGPEICPGSLWKVYHDTIIAVCSQSGASMVYILNDSGETIRQFSLGVLMSYPSIAALKTRCMFPAPIPSSSEWRWRSRLDGQKFWQFNAGQTYKNRGAVDDSGNFYFAGSQLKFPDSGVVLERVLIKLNPQEKSCGKTNGYPEKAKKPIWKTGIGQSEFQPLKIWWWSVAQSKKAIRTPATSPLILKDSRLDRSGCLEKGLGLSDRSGFKYKPDFIHKIRS